MANISSSPCSSFGVISPFNPDDRVRFDIAIVLIVLGGLHVFISLGVFFLAYLMLPGEHIRKRSRTLVVLVAFGTSLESLGVVNFSVYELPAPLYLTISLLLVPIITIPVPIKLFDFYSNVVFARAIAEVSIDAVDIAETEEGNQSPENQTIRGRYNTLSISLEGAVIPKLESPLPKGTLNELTNKTNLSPVRNAMASSNVFDEAMEIGSWTSSPMTNQEALDVARKKKVIPFKELLFLKFLASPRLKLFIIFLYFAPFVATIIANFIMFPELFQCQGDQIPPFNTIVIMVSIGISVLLGIIGALKVRHFYDPLLIARECRWYAQYGGMIALIAYSLGTKLASPPGFSFSFLVAIGFQSILFIVTELQVVIAYQRLPKDYTLWKIYALYHHERKRKLLFLKISSQKPSDTNDSSVLQELADFLIDAADVELFEKYLIGEFSVETLRMYIECRSWKINFYDSSDSTKRTRAKRIVTLFVQVGSVFEVNISATIREEIVEAVQGLAPLSVDLFKKSQEEMLGMMYDPYIRFANTHTYLNRKTDEI